MIEINEIWKIDGGLSYIQKLYPQAKLGKKFKARTDDDTASASLLKTEKGIILFTDFGLDSKGRNAIELEQLESNTDFGTALRTVAAFYGIEGGKVVAPRGEFESRPAGPDEAEGAFALEVKEWEDWELKTIIAPNVWKHIGKDDESRRKKAIETLTHYRWKSLKSYSVTKEGKTRTIGSNEQFPIFLIDEGDFKKVYKPLADKKYRFEVLGKFQPGYIHGLEQAKKAFSEAQVQDDDQDAEAPKKDRTNHKKLPEIILCTGGSDAINVALLSYRVIWANSETAKITEYIYKELQRIAEVVYNLPDIDATGKRTAHDLALEYLEIHTIQLPEELLNKTDRRGNPCKDVRDFFNHYSERDFKRLKETALPYQFWDVELVVDKEGEPKYKFGKKLYRYVANNVNLYNFLYKNGFARFVSAKEKDGFTYVQVKNGIVSYIKPSNVKDYIHNFLETRLLPAELRNAMFNTPRLSEQSLSNLKYFTGDFRTYGKDFQYIFFEQTAWKITDTGIKEESLKTITKNIWEHKVVKQKPKILPRMFEINKEGDDWNIEVLDNRSDFFKFLINTCRINWRIELEERLKDFVKLSDLKQKEYLFKYGYDDDTYKEAQEFILYHADTKEKQEAYRKEYQYRIDGLLLKPEEIAEQKAHLVNRIYAIGYALHRYKHPARPWAVFAMDAKLSEAGESHGGAGKGLVAKGLYQLLTKVQLDGRNKKLTENSHVFENVSTDTDLIHIEDTDEYFPFNVLFAPLTSAMTINPKNKQSIELQFDESPKFWLDTNYGDRYTDPSSIRRKLYTVFGDYYHENNGEYNESRSPKDDLGRSMYTDWDGEQWNLFYNFMAQCLAFYLSVDEKISPPMYNISKRNLMSEMGDHFREWADTYFDVDDGRRDTLIPKKEALEDMVTVTRIKQFSAHRFMKSLKAWAKFNDLELNPEELKNSSGRIIKRKGTTTEECIYLRSPGKKLNDQPF